MVPKMLSTKRIIFVVMFQKENDQIKITFSEIKIVTLKKVVQFCKNVGGGDVNFVVGLDLTELLELLDVCLILLMIHPLPMNNVHSALCMF